MRQRSRSASLEDREVSEVGVRAATCPEIIRTYRLRRDRGVGGRLLSLLLVLAVLS